MATKRIDLLTDAGAPHEEAGKAGTEEGPA